MKKVFTDFINESSLSRVYKHYLEHDTGTITAYRKASDCGHGEKYSNSQNRGRNKILAAKLLKKGYGITKLKGTYIEHYNTPEATLVKEDAFLVVDLKDTGTLRRDLIELGTMFEQDSITFTKVPNKGVKSGLRADGKYVLISTNTCENGYPGSGRIGVVERLGSPMFSKKGEFYSRVNGRPFVFESDFSPVYDFSSLEINSKRSITMLSEEPIESACEINIYD